MCGRNGGSIGVFAVQFGGGSITVAWQRTRERSAWGRFMRTANYVFSFISIILGLALILFMLTQSAAWNIGVAIGVVLVLNGAVRLWFAQDDQ